MQNEIPLTRYGFALILTHFLDHDIQYVQIPCTQVIEKLANGGLLATLGCKEIFFFLIIFKIKVLADATFFFPFKISCRCVLNIL